MHTLCQIMCIGTPLASWQLWLCSCVNVLHSTAAPPPLLRRRPRRQRRGGGHRAKTYTKTVSGAAAVRPSAFRHHHRRRCRCTSHGSCSGIPTPMPSLRQRQRTSGGSSGSTPSGPGGFGPGKFGPALELGRARFGSGGAAAALSAYSKLDLHTLLYSALFWQKRAAFLSSKF
jgi:hypothetical protein